MRSFHFLSITGLLFFPAACGDGANLGEGTTTGADEESNQGSGGSTGAADQSGGTSGSTTASGGAAQGSSGGNSQVEQNPAGGSAAAGGAVGAGGLSETEGSGGSMTGGASGSGGEAGSMTNPSPGCSKSGRPSGGKVYDAGKSWLLFPEKYDGNTPLPVLWGWHGCGSFNFGDANRTEYYDETRNSEFETNYVIAVPLAASGSCFDYNTDIVRTKALYDTLVENYCVDLDRMFGTGHSSGAFFMHSMLSSNHKADWDHLNLRGIAPVGSGNVGSQTTQVPVLYIHSPKDANSGDGQAPAGNFISANQCNMTKMPFAVDACKSSHDQDPVNANCQSYGDCDVPTIWCAHDDSAYDGTWHGIPCFFKQAAYDFFESL